MERRTSIEMIAKEDKESEYNINESPLSDISDALIMIYEIIREAGIKKNKDFFKSSEFQNARHEAVDFIKTVDIPREIIAPYRTTYAQLIKEARGLSIILQKANDDSAKKFPHQVPYKHRVERRTRYNPDREYERKPVSLFPKNMRRNSIY